MGLELPDGVYNLCCIDKTKFMSVLLVSKEEGTSPSLSRVWPTQLALVMNVFSLDNKELNLTSRLLDIYRLTKRAINMEFIKGLHYEKKFSIFEMFVPSFEDSETKPVVFTAEKGNVQALILPYRYNQD